MDGNNYAYAKKKLDKITLVAICLGVLAVISAISATIVVISTQGKKGSSGVSYNANTMFGKILAAENVVAKMDYDEEIGIKIEVGRSADGFGLAVYGKVHDSVGDGEKVLGEDGVVRSARTGESIEVDAGAWIFAANNGKIYMRQKGFDKLSLNMLTNIASGAKSTLEYGGVIKKGSGGDMYISRGVFGLIARIFAEKYGEGWAEIDLSAACGVSKIGGLISHDNFAKFAKIFDSDGGEKVNKDQKETKDGLDYYPAEVSVEQFEAYLGALSREKVASSIDECSASSGDDWKKTFANGLFSMVGLGYGGDVKYGVDSNGRISVISIQPSGISTVFPINISYEKTDLITMPAKAEPKSETLTREALTEYYTQYCYAMNSLYASSNDRAHNDSCASGAKATVEKASDEDIRRVIGY